MNIRSKSKIMDRGSVSGIAGLKTGAMNRTYLKGSVKAKRVEVLWSDIETTTAIHELNPRNQEALTVESVSDILPSIQDNGINQEGLAIKCPASGKLLLLDSSRRRFCAIEAQVSLPLWVIEQELETKDILALINDSQEVKKWSYVEHGRYLLKVAEISGLDVNALTKHELADALGIGRETLRKRLEAVGVHETLRNVFVSSESIPNNYYSDLAKLEKKLTKANLNVAEQLATFSQSMPENEATVDMAECHKQTLDDLKVFVDTITNVKAKEKPVLTKLGNFEQKYMSANKKKSADGKKTVYEFNRIPADIQRQIDEFIEGILPPKNPKN